MADVPGLSWGELPRLVRWRYLSQGTRWTDLIEAGVLVRSLCAATGLRCAQARTFLAAPRADRQQVSGDGGRT